MVGRMNRPTGGSTAPWLAAVLTALGGAFPATSARGADDVVATAEPPATGDSFLLDFDQQIDAMLQGLPTANGGGDVPTPMELRMAAIDAVCGLDPAQVARCAVLASVIEAAGEASVARLRETYGGRSCDLGMPEGQQEWQRLHEEFARVRQSAEDATGPRGVLSRLLVGILDDRQRGLWAEESRRRDAEVVRDMLEEGLETFVIELGLTSSQRDAIAALTFDTPSPIDSERAMATFGSANPLLFIAILSKVDRERIDEVLDEQHRPLVTKMLDDARGMIRHIEGMIRNPE